MDWLWAYFHSPNSLFPYEWNSSRTPLFPIASFSESSCQETGPKHQNVSSLHIIAIMEWGQLYCLVFFSIGSSAYGHVSEEMKSQRSRSKLLLYKGVLLINFKKLKLVILLLKSVIFLYFIIVWVLLTWHSLLRCGKCKLYKCKVYRTSSVTFLQLSRYT